MMKCLVKQQRNEALISKKYVVKKPPYSPMLRYVVRSNGGQIKVKQHISRRPHDPSDNSNEEELEIIIDSNHISIDEGSDMDISEDGIQNAPPQLEDRIQATIDELKELNLGSTEEPRPIFISALLSPKEEEQYFKTLVIESSPSDLIPRIETEINKLIDVGFIKEDDFPLPITKLMVDVTTGHEALSFIDSSFRYNTIRMSPKDEECTTFCTPKGIY
ncbi:hypothetical protein Sango_2696800 [Sesamum angolense]|uniref:Reverse transcriptase domain-containing protein n=1 Tax=Sesamum angolense TaxID=2727404 RepID=A0AAE2BHM3_9LAMI|nr:hypothetical protein Sango_2696800 [Sesamum angolense]